MNTVDAIVEEEHPLGVKIKFDANPLIASPMQSPSQVSPPLRVVKKSASMGSGSLRWNPISRKNSIPRPSTAEKGPVVEEFSPITTPIPTDSLLDEDFLRTLSFSKRGSMMLGGEKAVNSQARTNAGRYVRFGTGHKWLLTDCRQPIFSMLASPSVGLLSDDLEKESQKVRSMYEQGSNLNWEAGAQSGITERLNAEQPSTGTGAETSK